MTGDQRRQVAFIIPVLLTLAVCIYGIWLVRQDVQAAQSRMDVLKNELERMKTSPEFSPR